MHTENELLIPEIYKKHFKLKLQMFDLSKLHVKLVGTFPPDFMLLYLFFIL